MPAPFPAMSLPVVALLLTVSCPLFASDALPAIVAASSESPVTVTSTELLPLIIPTSAVTERDSSVEKTSKNGARKNKDEAPASASESASQRAREEWQKQFASTGRKPAPEKKNPAKNRPADSKPGKSNESSKVKSQKQATSSAVQPPLPAIIPQSVWSPRYSEVYRSIPFSRAEYDADPTYRHNATMELLLKQLRPAAPKVETDINVTVQPLAPYRNSYPLRSGYRAWSRYPWH
jgi:hypothetical protein